MKSSRRIWIAIGLSVLAHLALFAFLIFWVPPPPKPAPPPPRPFTVQIVDLPPLPPLRHTPSAAAHPPVPASPKEAAPRPRVAQRPAPPTAAPAHRTPPHPGKRPTSPSTGASSPKLAADAPRAAPILVPHDIPGGIPVPQGSGSTGGHLIHNDGKTHPTPEEVAQEDAHARGNVQAWVSDDLARARVRVGSVDGYFSDLRHAFEAAAKDPPPFTPKEGMLSYGQSWQRDAQAFGKDGTLQAGRIPTGEMRDFENHHHPIPEPGTNAERIMNGLAGTEMRAHASDGATGGGRVTVVEIRQARDGKVEAVTLRKGSGDPRFDAFVLASAREGAQKAKAMPDHGAGIHPNGTRSVWAFVGTLVFRKSTSQLKKEGKSTAAIAGRAVTSLLGGGLGFDETSGVLEVADGTPTYQVHAKLLAVY